MELTPERYVCGEHGADLTELVREQVTESRPVAFGRRGPRPFLVVVACPAGTHELTFTGEVTGR
ncbi:MAG TPA: hypothetical protein VFT95_23455, partial [Micromonosporaceae bacterium]|nr:hypothetical protein [Micromonosporaceae bacterium]